MVLSASDARGADVDFAQTAFETVRLQLMRGGAISIRLDDVGASANVFGVNFAHEVGRDEIQFVVGAIDVDALGVEHRAHRAIEDVNGVGLNDVSEGFHAYLANSKQ